MPAMTACCDDNEIQPRRSRQCWPVWVTVHALPTGPEGIARGRSTVSTTILMDISMPGIKADSGPTQVICKAKAPCQHPDMAVTAHARPMNAPPLRPAAMTAAFCKPINTRRKTALSDWYKPRFGAINARMTHRPSAASGAEQPQVDELIGLWTEKPCQPDRRCRPTELRGSCPRSPLPKDGDQLQTQDPRPLPGFAGCSGRTSHALLATIENDCKLADSRKARDQPG